MICAATRKTCRPRRGMKLFLQRESQVAQGKMAFVDLDEARERIRKATR